MTVRLAIAGASGRMGRALVDALTGRQDLALVGLTDGPDSAMLGQSVAGVGVTGDAGSVFRTADVVADFTVPAATRAHAGLAAETGTALVIGTTGLTPDDQDMIARAAQRTAIVQAANFSLGVNLLEALVRQAAERLGPPWDIEILEMHHRNKVDAPSGTALALGRAAAAGRGVDFETMRSAPRDGLTGERPRGHIGFGVLRGGDVAGEHSVIFAGAKERLELAHKATDRSIFAYGALHAAAWAAGRAPGLYTMADVLDLT